MDWVSALAIVTIVVGLSTTVAVLLALGALRQSFDETTTRQSQQIKRLAENVTTLNQQQQAAQLRIQVLTEANRKLADDLTTIGERISDGDGPSRPAGTPRLLH